MAASAAMINTGQFFVLQWGKLLHPPQNIPSQPIPSWQSTAGTRGSASCSWLLWTNSKGWSWAVMDQGTHQERNPGLASCWGKLNSPRSTRAQPGEDHNPVQLRSPGPVRFPAVLRSQLFKAAGSSPAVLWLCSPLRVHHEQGYCLFCSSAFPGR